MSNLANLDEGGHDRRTVMQESQDDSNDHKPAFQTSAYYISHRRPSGNVEIARCFCMDIHLMLSNTQANTIAHRLSWQLLSLSYQFTSSQNQYQNNLCNFPLSQ